MKQAKIKASTLGKIFKFLEKERGEEVPSTIKYLTGDIKFEIAKENLSVTKFNNGDALPEAKTPEEWVEFGKKEVPAFMRNGNDFHYNHYAVMDERGLAPEGWRVPTQEDLLYIKYQKLYRNFPLAGFLKFDNGLVNSAGSSGHYWSSKVVGTNARFLYFRSSYAKVFTKVLSSHRANGFSIRCVRDEN